APRAVEDEHPARGHPRSRELARALLEVRLRRPSLPDQGSVRPRRTGAPWPAFARCRQERRAAISAAPSSRNRPLEHERHAAARGHLLLALVERLVLEGDDTGVLTGLALPLRQHRRLDTQRIADE